MFRATMQIENDDLGSVFLARIELSKKTITVNAQTLPLARL